MALTWRLIEEDVDRESAWDEVVESCGYATFFHTRAWAELFAETLRTWQPNPVAIEFSDGNVLVLPMMNRLDSEHRQSTVPGMYGGPLFRDQPTEEHWAEFDKVPRWYTDIFVVDNPYSPYRWDPNGLVKWASYTHVTDLSAGFDAVWKNVRENIRRNTRKAEGSGIEISQATDAAHAREYFTVYQDATSRFGDSLQSYYPIGLFENLLRMPGHVEHVRLSLARLDGRVVSGLVMLYWGDVALAWHYSTRPDDLSSNACPLLIATAMRQASEDGFRWFDFLCSGSLAGVARFKEGFGSDRVPYNLFWSPGMTSESTRPDTGPGAAGHRIQQLQEDQRRRPSEGTT